MMREVPAGPKPSRRMQRLLRKSAEATGGDPARMMADFRTRIEGDPKATAELRCLTEHGVKRELDKIATGWLVRQGYRPTPDDWNKWRKADPEPTA
jgi:hypothetical protein